MTDRLREPLIAPFQYFGGKRSVAADVWKRFGTPKQFIEPFCGSAAVLLAAPRIASLEVVNDYSGFIANFWRAVKYQPAAVAEAADYPVSHIDMGARHKWLMAQRARIGEALHAHDWPGDAEVAGLWLWGQCSWIGSGWCEWTREKPPVEMIDQAVGRIPHLSNAGQGVQAAGKIPHASDAGRGVQAAGKIPHISDGGLGVMSISKAAEPTNTPNTLLTSCGRTAWIWLHKLASRLERVRIVHGDWSRCLNHQYGADNTAVFLDPPYRAYERLYGEAAPVADAVAKWAKEHPHLRIALCGHRGDYNLPGWDVVEWSRSSATYGSNKTKDEEAIWYSPACISRERTDLFAEFV